MEGFKFLAFRPLFQSEIKLTRILKRGEIYKFYNDYHFLNNEGSEVRDEEVSCVKFLPTQPNNLFKTSDVSKLKINISAVVGKNGSGKSTLLELFYLACYIIAEKNFFITDSRHFQEQWIETQNDYWRERLREYEMLLHDVSFDIFYVWNDSIYKINYSSNKLSLFRQDNSGFSPAEKFFPKDFFYTVAINYSIYGLNSKITGEWLNSLFHKNDGYQTPVVINPYRSEGNIDINSEYHLAQSRLLLNIVDYKDRNISLANNKKLERIEFLVDPNELKSFRSVSINKIFHEFESIEGIHIIDFFQMISFELIGHRLSEGEIDYLKSMYEKDMRPSKTGEQNIYPSQDGKIEYGVIQYYAVKYCLKKVFKICYQYDDYDFFRIEINNNSKDPIIPGITDLSRLTSKLKDDKSHITLKLYQILYAIKERYFSEGWRIQRNPSNPELKVFCYNASIEDFSKMISKAREHNQKVFKEEEEELVPNAFFIPKIIISDFDSKRLGYEFAGLSSGEQQFIHSIQSILYHIKNLDSVFESANSGRIKYHFLNIILDEVELYYHPEFQRIFINELIKGIENLRIKHVKGLNILFSTHSPFILSDIPHQNILKLKGGEIVPFSQKNKTYGANVHEMLANDFYLENGFMGELAKRKIQSLISYLDKGLNDYNGWTPEIASTFINTIGEPILRDGLQKLYFKAFQNDDEIDREIERLQNLKTRK